MKIVHISDTHQSFPKDLPDGDILVHSGDHGLYPKDWKHFPEKMDECYQKLNLFFSSLLVRRKFKHIIFVPGNHDIYFEKFESQARNTLNSATVLMNEGVIIDGIKIYGSPVTPEFCDWAFNISSNRIAHYWDLIPEDTNILITHGPPFGILDKINHQSLSLGCPELAKKIWKLPNLKCHLFGHIHGSGGNYYNNGQTIFSNASFMDEGYYSNNSHNIIDLGSNLRISIDLELEQPCTNPQAPDSLLNEERIIQVGWVVFDPKTSIIYEKQCLNVNIGVPLSSFIKKLTKITDDDISGGSSLQEIYDELVSSRKKWNATRGVLQWGSGDIEILQKEMGYPENWPFGRSGHNVKHLFQSYAEINGLNCSGGLKKCMKSCKIVFEGMAHNALNDALNTAKFYSFLINKLKD